MNTLEVAAAVAEVVRLAAAVAGIYLTVGTVMATVQAHIGKQAGLPGVGADVTRQIILITLCFAFAVSADDVAREVAGFVTPVATGDEAVIMWRLMAEFIVKTIVLITGASVTLSVTGSGLAAQVATAFGQPNAVGMAVVRIVMAAAGAGLTYLGAALADTIALAALAG